MKNKKALQKIMTIGLTGLIFLCGVSPQTFSIPLLLRPWILLISIVWVIVFCTGVLNS